MQMKLVITKSQSLEEEKEKEIENLISKSRALSLKNQKI